MTDSETINRIMRKAPEKSVRKAISLIYSFCATVFALALAIGAVWAVSTIILALERV